jgi:hypothetical protein
MESWPAMTKVLPYQRRARVVNRDSRLVVVPLNKQPELQLQGAPTQVGHAVEISLVPFPGLGRGLGGLEDLGA